MNHGIFSFLAGINARRRQRTRQPMLLLCRAGRSIQRAEKYNAFSVIKNYKKREEWLVVGFEDDRSRNVLAVYFSEEEARDALAGLWRAMNEKRESYIFKGGDFDA